MLATSSQQYIASVTNSQYNSQSLLSELQQFKLLTAFLWLGSLGDAPGDAPTPCSDVGKA